jgi:hypothetical protein
MAKKKAENERNDENIVDRQAPFDEVACVELHRAFLPHLGPDPAAKGECDGHVTGRENHALPDADLAACAMQHAQVQDQERDDDPQEDQPQPALFPEEHSEKDGVEEIHGHLPLTKPRKWLRHRDAYAPPEGPGA